MFTDSAILTQFVYLTTVTHVRYLVSNWRTSVSQGRSTLYRLTQCQGAKDRKGSDLKGRGCRYGSHLNFCGGRGGGW